MEEAWMEKDPFELPLDYRSELLVQFGFIKPDKKAEYQYNEQKKMWERADGRSVNKDDADEQEIEVTYRNVHGKTGFPNASKTYRLAWEVPDLSLEEPYYWLLEALREAFTVIEKLEDTKEELTETATKKLDSALAHIEELQEHGRETTASIRKRLFKNLPKRS